MKRIHRHDIFLVLLALSVALASATCRSATGPNTGSCGPVSTAHGTMSATIDGAPWSTALVAATRDMFAPGGFQMSGSDGCNPLRTLTISLVTDDRTGTLPIDRLELNGLLQVGPFNLWIVTPTEGATMTINTQTASGASGTFDNFMLLPLAGSGATGTKTITHGTFAVTF